MASVHLDCLSEILDVHTGRASMEVIALLNNRKVIGRHRRRRP